MKLITLTMGLYEVNNYILFDEESRDIILIDAGGDFERTKETIDSLNGNFKYILHTHGHMDHISGDFDLQNHYNVPAYLHKNDENLISQMKEYLRVVGMPDYEQPKNIKLFESDEVFKIGNTAIKVIHTPGHTQGCVSYLIDDMLFSGDTLFWESVGRSDLPGGNHEQLIKSVREKLFVLPEDIKVFPGHGDTTTIKHEKTHNCYA